MKIKGNAAIVSALMSHILTWVALLWLLLWPYSYRGVKTEATVPGELPGPSTEVHASFLAVNGLRVIPILLIPVAITAILLAVTASKHSRKTTTIAAWTLVSVLLFFCVLGVFSIGPLYLPAALAAAVTAFMLLRRKPELADH